MTEAVLQACYEADAHLQDADSSDAQLWDALFQFALRVAPFCSIYDRKTAAAVLGYAREFAGRLARGRTQYVLHGVTHACDGEPRRALAFALRPLGAQLAMHAAGDALAPLLEQACIVAAAAQPKFDANAPPASEQWQICGAILEMATYTARVQALQRRAVWREGTDEPAPAARTQHTTLFTEHLFNALVPAGYTSGFHYHAVAQPVPADPGFNQIAHNVVFTARTRVMLAAGSDVDLGFLKNGPWWVPERWAAGGDVQAVARDVLARAEEAYLCVSRAVAHVPPLHWSFTSCMTTGEPPDTLTLQFAGRCAYVADESGVIATTCVALGADLWAQRYLEPVE